MLTVLLRAYVNNADIVYLEHFYVLLKAFKAFDLINLGEVHLVLDHVVPALEHVLLASIVVDLLHDWLAASVCFYLGLDVLGLVLLQHLFAGDDVLDFTVNFVFNVARENTVDRLDFVIDDE